MVKIKFRNINEIQKYYQKELSAGNLKSFENIKSKDGKNYGIVTDKILVAEAQRLKKCIQKYIDKYYSEYPESTYEKLKRTNGLRNALTAEKIVSISKGKKSIGLYFDDSMSWGRSFVTNEWNGHKPWLINDGWTVKKPVSFKNTRAGHFEGFHFIEKGIEDWKKDLKYNIDIVRVGAQHNNFEMAEKFGYTFE